MFSISRPLIPPPSRSEHRCRTSHSRVAAWLAQIWDTLTPNIYIAVLPAGQRNQNFNALAIGGWLLIALYQAGVITSFIIIGHDSRTISRSAGQPFSMFESGVCMFTIVVTVVHLEAMQVCVCVYVCACVCGWVGGCVQGWEGGGVGFEGLHVHHSGLCGDPGGNAGLRHCGWGWGWIGVGVGVGGCWCGCV